MKLCPVKAARRAQIRLITLPEKEHSNKRRNQNIFGASLEKETTLC
jgi:hypothetical protein